eukprot:TRINITY_DN17108_c0_g1_i1.p1 TRINITY_DN17108_c0_g1~~TRINITY_DN17108_c0_g1_i1.p1  ORF type:complete len:234 (+),score=27.93 TRINITY_DN17108_c0_g1_i1:107-808(+)
MDLLFLLQILNSVCFSYLVAELTLSQDKSKWFSHSKSSQLVVLLCLVVNLLAETISYFHTSESDAYPSIDLDWVSVSLFVSLLLSFAGFLALVKFLDLHAQHAAAVSTLIFIALELAFHILDVKTYLDSHWGARIFSIVVAYTVLCRYATRHLDRQDFIIVYGGAIAKSVALWPLIVLAIACALLALSSVTDALGISHDFVSPIIYYSLLYGPTTSVYVMVRLHRSSNSVLPV